jgi:uroporphyrinogen-III synthase
VSASSAGRDRRTLDGRVIVITRARPEAGRLAAELERRGATPLVAPAIRIEPAPSEDLDRALRDLAGGAFEWVVLTSRAGVRAVTGRLRRLGLWPAAAGRSKVAAVGAGTAGALREQGVEPDLVPATFTTEALAEAMPAGRGRVLLARADIAPEALETVLAAKGWTTVRVDAYRTAPARRMPPEAARALDAGAVDAVTFTSASTVRGFVGMAGPRAKLLREGDGRPRVVCIGPVTARQAVEAGLPVDAVASPHTIEGLVAAVERALGEGGRRQG